MRALTRTSTRLHANACLLRERRACDTATAQGAWLSVPPFLSMDMKRGNACKPNNGCRMRAQPHLKSDLPRTLANVGTSSSSPEEPHLASAPAWWFSWYGPRPIPQV